MSAIKEHYHSQIERGLRTPHKIGWLNLPGYKGETWNPIIGCSKVSAGCENCYAERMALRLSYNPKTPGYYHTTTRHAHAIPSGWNGRTYLLPEALNKPLRWKKLRVVFVCSMGDLFHEDTSFEDINAVFSVMSDCDQHIYIVLTKRPQRIIDFYNWKSSFGVPWIPKDNIWLGVTAENQEQANIRIPYLNSIYAAVKLVSVEPMIGPVNLCSIPHFKDHLGNAFFRDVLNQKSISGNLITAYSEGLDWVICGGESGPGARPLHPDWARSLRDQCQAAGVPFFFKQWGELLPACQVKNIRQVGRNSVQFPSPHNPEKKNTYYKIGKKNAGNLLDGEHYEEYPITNTQYPMKNKKPVTSNLKPKTLNFKL